MRKVLQCLDVPEKSSLRITLSLLLWFLSKVIVKLLRAITNNCTNNVIRLKIFLTVDMAQAPHFLLDGSLTSAPSNLFLLDNTCILFISQEL